MRLLACFALMATTTFAGWERSVSGAEYFTDSPPPHSFAYFRVDPCLRPNSMALGRAIDCATPGFKSAELAEVGKIGQFTIYDLWYSRNGHYSDVRSVLVMTGVDQYREINVQVRRAELFPASEIVTLDGEPILIAKSHDGGNHNRIDNVFYMFRPSGLVAPDFEAIGQAVKKVMPANMSVRTVTDDFEAMTQVVETYRSDLNLPPVSVEERGRITVSYRFMNGRAVVTSAKYEPHLLGK